MHDWMDWAFVGFFSVFALESAFNLKDRFVAWVHPDVDDDE